ncbi:MAG: ATP-binding protein [Spirochaetota bacterium]
MQIPRYYDNLSDYLSRDKVVVIYGPRQVGKTTLLKNFSKRQDKKIRFDTGDDYRIQEVWGSGRLDLLREYVEGYDIVIVDEAQRVPGIGMGLKLLIDAELPVNLIVTGSSSFELAGQVGEPLTGRKKTIYLFPIAQMELANLFNRFELKEKLEDYLVYGSYPEVVSAARRTDKIDILNEISGSYLLKDILELDRVRSAKVLLDLLRLLAFQIGNQVSLRELGNHLGLDFKTVARYLDLLEKAFVIFNVRGYSRNLRKEITKKSKYYFYDTGIRNALISNFTSLNLRDDVGALWENFLFIERMKKCSYNRIYANIFFWRTWDRQEIDYLEEREGKLFGYEFKWRSRKMSPPKDWTATYPNGEFAVITQANYLDFII